MLFKIELHFWAVRACKACESKCDNLSVALGKETDALWFLLVRRVKPRKTKSANGNKRRRLLSQVLATEEITPFVRVDWACRFTLCATSKAEVHFSHHCTSMAADTPCPLVGCNLQRLRSGGTAILALVLQDGSIQCSQCTLSNRRKREKTQ